MKSLFRVLLSAFLLAGNISCSEIEITGNETETKDLANTTLTKAEAAVANTQSEFCLDIFREVAKQDIQNDILISPFSLSVDMAMLLDATDGNTHDELVKGLGFEGYKAEDISSYYSTTLKSFNESALSIANALWYDSSVRVKEDYISAVRNSFDASVTGLNFAEAPASSLAKEINDWASQNTRGKIKNFVTRLPGNTAAILTNALYFQSSWSASFNKEKKQFTNLSGKSANRDFFTGGKKLEFKEYNTWKSDDTKPSMLWVPYKDGFRMLIILPPACQSFKDFIDTFTYDKYRSWIASGDVTTRDGITIHIPLFKNKFEMDGDMCKNALATKGINLLFDETRADLSKMSSEKQLFVNKILQKTTIDVNESGTTASAATSIFAGYETATLVPGPKEYDFVVDRPFVYAILDYHDTFLFMGTVVK